MTPTKITPILQVGLFGVGKIAFLFVTILLYKAFPAFDIGLFAVIYAIAIILATVSECGMRGLLVREMARSHDAPDTARRLLAGALNARLLTLLPYLIFGLLAGQILLPQNQVLILGLLLTAAWLDSNAFVFRGALRAYNYIILDATVAALSRLILLGLTALLFWQQRLTLLNFSILFAIIALSDVLATLVFVRIKTSVVPTLRCSLHRTIAMIKRGIPFILLNVIGILYMRTAILFLGASGTESSLYETAGFNLSGRIPEGVSFLPIALMNVAIPFFSRNSSRLDRVMPVFRQLEFLMGCAGIIISVGLISFAEQFILLLATPEYLPHIVTFRLYAVTIFFTFLQYVYANLLICMDQERRVARRYGIVLVLNVALNTVLVCKLAATGAVIALLLCELIAILIDSQYLLKSGIRPAANAVTKWLIILAGSAVLAFLATLLPHPFGLIIYWFTAGLTGAIILLRSDFSSLVYKTDPQS